MRTRRYIFLLTTAGFITAHAQAHNHATIDTQGDTIQLRAGYLASESAYTVDDTRKLLYNGLPATYLLTEMQRGGEFDGWYTQDVNLLTLTSDFFYASGRLGNGWDSQNFVYSQPGDFHYEIVEVIPIDGSLNADFAHVLSSASGGVSSATDQPGRSYHVGVGAHDHGQRMFIEHAGTYDIRYRAWDSTGQFDTDTSSMAVSDLVVRVTVPEPGVLTLALPVLAVITMRRRKA